ncbi:MAG: polysaccharide biosynthesis/export family protein [Verrucomicrobiota bacterium]
MRSTGFFSFALAVLLSINSLAYGQDDIVYRLSSFDKVSISVYGEPDLSTEQLISDNGIAFIPLLGQVSLGGLTVAEASSMIEKKFVSEEYLRKPLVTVSIEEFSPKVVTVLGEVENPGSVEIPPGKNGIPLPVAVAGAGGFSGTAKLNEIRITRTNPEDPSKPLNVVINLTKALDSSSKSKDLESMLVFAEDIVFVPRRVF